MLALNIKIEIQKLERRLNRLIKQKDNIEKKHGNSPSSNFTYHGGFDLGYLKGKIAILEEWIDELKNEA